MKATVFRAPNKFGLEEKDIPEIGPNDALIRITLTTICGTDIHIVKGEYAVRPGLTIGHEPVGIIEKLGTNVSGYECGERVLVGAITPCGQCGACLSGKSSQCGHGHGHCSLGGWQLGNTSDGAQAEYMVVPYAQVNLAKIPPELSDEQVVLLSDIASTGISGAESADIKTGDSVVIFGQGPIGLCATAGAKLRGAGLIITIDSIEERLALSKQMGASITLNFQEQDVLLELKRLTGGVDVAIEALGSQSTFEAALRSLKPGGTLSSLGVYADKLEIPYDAFGAGLADQKIVTTLCPGGKERMRRLMELVRYGQLDLTPLITHRFALADIAEAYRIFMNKLDGVVKVAIQV